MSKEMFPNAGSDAAGASTLSAVPRSDSDHDAKQRFEKYLTECVERLFTEVSARLATTLQQTLGRLVTVQSRAIDVMEKMEAEQRYMRAQIEQLTAEIANLRRGAAAPQAVRSRRPWTHRHRRLFVIPRPRLPKTQD
ncbi:MAG: hypothetical protein NZ585_08455 [Chloracidobacterium sp.]|nr:hypothetical protein [Chloracidobacterium sp.]MDW8217334.1 hypothetical protein [Acidobacteriota bacterium]